MNWALPILLLVFLGAGVPIFLGTLVHVFRTHRILRKGAHAEGIIVEAEQGKKGRVDRERLRAKGYKVFVLNQPTDWGGGTVKFIWTLTIEFEDATGARQQGTIDAGAGKIPYEVGQRVSIWYDPKQPSAIRIDSFAELWGGPLLVGVFGASFIVMGLLLWSGAIPLG
ncbi:MAG: DUF3592 domain-containing protein [Planctomycetes bacterium]|nr:DUF3592 domain-containing protein [Planctomycetota bacterium]